MMGWLKRVGQIAVQITSAIVGFGPLYQQLRPEHAGLVARVTDSANRIADIIMQAEIMGAALGLSGEQKLRAAAPAVAQIVLQSDLLTGRKIDDPAKFRRGVAAIASGFADILSSLEDTVQTDSHT